MFILGYFSLVFAILSYVVGCPSLTLFFALVSLGIAFRRNR